MLIIKPGYRRNITHDYFHDFSFYLAYLVSIISYFSSLATQAFSFFSHFSIGAFAAAAFDTILIMVFCLFSFSLFFGATIGSAFFFLAHFLSKNFIGQCKKPMFMHLLAKQGIVSSTTDLP